MFEIGEVVWMEYDGSEAFVGQLIALDEEDVTMIQVVEFKTHVRLTERLIKMATASVNGLSWVNARAQFLSYMGVLGLPWLVLGEQAVRTKLVWLVAEEAIKNGQGYLRNLDTPLRIVLPRGGAVFKDAKTVIDDMIPSDEGEEVDEATEAEVTAAQEAEVAAFRESLDGFAGLDAEDPEGSVSGNQVDPDPDNKPEF